MNYKYTLEKSSKKHICPRCGKKRFVRFINNETNEYLDHTFGRCDRETSCGYFNKPNESFVLVEPTTQLIPIKAISKIEKSIVSASIKQFDKNNLHLFLSKYFDANLVTQTFKNYKVGTSKKWDGATVFWQVDENQNIRTGKIMLYNALNGKRVKKPYNHISWAHKALKIDDFNLKQCLFGLHLTADKSKTIGLVEAEKTAITMDLFLPNCHWLATGSKQNLKEELLNPIKDFKIIAYPDKSEFNDWQVKCNLLVEKGFDITCSTLVEKSSIIEGSDLADIYFDLENKNIDNTPLSNIETSIQKLHSKNPAIKNFIDTFGLTDQAGNTIRTDLF